MAEQYRNPFYHEVEKDVRKELDRRGIIHGLTYRSGATQKTERELIWPYGKNAYCYITSNKWKGKAIGTAGTESSGFESLYDTAQRNLPKEPLLQSTSITSEGRMGSIQKATVKLKVFTIEQLERVESQLLMPGIEVTISYGWSTFAAVDTACKDKFIGVVSNFSWDFSPDGSFDVSLSAVGKGYFAGGIPMDASIPDKPDDNSGGTPKDASGFSLYATNLSTMIDSDLEKLTEIAGGSSGAGGGRLIDALNNPDLVAKFESGYGVVFVSMDTSGDEGKHETENTKGTKSNQQKDVKPEVRPVYYVSLGDLVSFFNKNVIEQSDKMSQTIKYTVWGSLGSRDVNVVSCRPNEVLFSDELVGGQSTYGNIIYPIPGGDIRDFTGLTFPIPDNAINLARIWISTDVIKETFNTLADEKAVDPTMKTVNKFFEDLFGKISSASGDIYQLSIIISDDTSVGKQGLATIVDTNYSDAQVKPYRFDYSVHKSVVQNMSMGSKLPSRMATAAYVGGRSSGIADKSANADVFNDEKMTDEEKQKKAFEAKTVEEQLTELRQQVGSGGVQSVVSEQMYGILKKYSTNPTNGDASWLNNKLFPIDLQITIDGIAGFTFGDVVTFDYMPSRYKKANIVFTVRNVSHEISGNVWSTTLETDCRVGKET